MIILPRHHCHVMSRRAWPCMGKVPDMMASLLGPQQWGMGHTEREGERPSSWPMLALVPSSPCPLPLVLFPCLLSSQRHPIPLTWDFYVFFHLVCICRLNILSTCPMWCGSFDVHRTFIMSLLSSLNRDQCIMTLSCPLFWEEERVTKNK